MLPGGSSPPDIPSRTGESAATPWIRRRRRQRRHLSDSIALTADAGLRHTSASCPPVEYVVPQLRWRPQGWAEAAGALGLIVGLFVPARGVAAAIGLLLYFAGPVITVPAGPLVDDRGVSDSVPDPGRGSRSGCHRGQNGYIQRPVR
ncbi:DoxX family protein [Nocardia niwae]|uniref:DoxX family protein n=1 Tax=Nocardia niwae TaxID=626084 RepID=UPI0033E92AA2